MTLFIVVVAESNVIVVKEAIFRYSLLNGRTQRRDSLKWYEEVGEVKQVHEHLIAFTMDSQE